MNFNERNPLSVSSLSVAVEENAVEALRQLIKKGRNINITDNRGWTPLHEAACLGHLECLLLLLKAGARTEVKTHHGETPFFIACKYNRMEVVKTLLHRNKSVVNTADNEFVTPLHISCTDHNLGLAQFLIKNNANINAEDNSGLTPLQEAVMREDLDICKLLLENGADLYSREYDGHMAFHFACMARNVEVLKLLVDQYKSNLSDVINSGNCCGFTPLMLAVQSRSLDVTNELLKLGANPAIIDNNNTLALHLAAHTGNLDVLKCLLKVTSVESITKYCSMPRHLLEACIRNDSNNSMSHQRSLVSLVVDSENLDCLEYIFNCGLDHVSLNCPIIDSEVLPPFFEDMHNHALFGPHRNIEIEVNVTDLILNPDFLHPQTIVLHPISFLLKQKMSDLGKDTVKYLRFMLENGLTFDCADCNVNKLLVIHPYDALMFNYHSNGEAVKDIVIDCLHLMIESGISVDYVCKFHVNETVPIIFVYACRLRFFEIIPCLLQHSNLIDLDDLLRWVVHKIFMRIDPPPHFIEKSLLEAYKYLTQYTSKSIKNFVDDVKKPEYEARFSSIISFIDNDNYSAIPSLKIICRSVIRGTVKRNCNTCPHQLRIRLNNLELPSSLLNFLNYHDMLDKSGFI